MAARRMRRFRSAYPTVDQINSDVITKLAVDYWAPIEESDTLKPFELGVVKGIYQELASVRFSNRRLVLLDFSQYLERFLWPNFSAETAKCWQLVMSIVVLVNEKKRERAPVWHAFTAYPTHFPEFFKQVLILLSIRANVPDQEIPILSVTEKCQLLIFLSHCVNSLEEDIVREQAQKIFGLPIWFSLSPKRLEIELKRVPNLRKAWDRLVKKDLIKDDIARAQDDLYRNFMRDLMQQFLTVLNSVPASGELEPGFLGYCEHFLNLMIDCQSSLNTRRFFHALMEDAHILVKCKLSYLHRRPEGRVFAQLIDALEFYSSYEITLSGNDVTEQERNTEHYNRLAALQRTVFKLFTDKDWSRKFATAPIYKIDTRDALNTFLQPLGLEDLKRLAGLVGVLGTASLDTSDQDEDRLKKHILTEVLIDYHERRVSQLQRVNQMPIYPTEDIIWDEALVPDEFTLTSDTMPLPKLHLQFLSLHDYLLRNFQLFRLESAYEIRTDIEDAIARMKPWTNETGGVVFGGWARMALPINQFEVFDVGKPDVGCKQPSRVRAKITVTLTVRQAIKDEWQSLRKHDICFLLTVKPNKSVGTAADGAASFLDHSGLVYVRGCEIEGMLDDRGQLIDELSEQKPVFHGETRQYRVWLDTNQYYLDNQASPGSDIYRSFNILLRRKPEENNFKAVLETIRTLINSEWVVPDWLHDILLGYGDPESAHWTKLNSKEVPLDFNDTFLSLEHVKACFLDEVVEFANPKNLSMQPPFRITFSMLESSGESGTKRNAEGEAIVLPKRLTVEPYAFKSNTPYPHTEPKRNAVPFTPAQTQAIISGMQHGLTLIVGPPGTGKTDVAVQIISNIYHNFPEQRTLIVTHSNQALNQLFEKIMDLDIDERHLLRLGHGEEALETKKDFSRYGRVNYVLAKRLELLSEVGRLQTSLGVPGDVAYTCETAGHFYLYQVVPRWQTYMNKIRSAENETVAMTVVSDSFPFTNFFNNAPQPLFQNENFADDMETSELCYRYVDNIFTQLEEFRPFELLRSGLDRTRYLLTKEAKIIAMTCTHAGMKRQELVELGFKYDNILMEEAAQILEVETFIPLLLQKPEHGYNRLKRWIMIGDHNQLPPIVQNKVFEKFCNMEQSLFTRFVRLGVPTVDLDAQGRMRSSLCRLFSWRYKRLGNLPHTLKMPAFLTANAGFAFDYQLINVEDYNGVGESEPSAHFIQNLAEAEYIVATFTYMRLLGYPASSITILAAYNGQKHLIRDVIEKRCGSNPLVGWPHKIATVDKYQGQQNDYVLLSLVRTKTVGYLRDVRRVVVALSRARLGLYVFARIPLFRNCFELSPAVAVLMERPSQLHVVPAEQFPVERKLSDPISTPIKVMKDMPDMMKFVYELYAEKVQLLKPVFEAQMAAQAESSDSEPEEEAATTEEGNTEKSESKPGPTKINFLPVEDLPFFAIRGDKGVVVEGEQGDDDE